MALFRRKEKEQHIVPHSTVEHAPSVPHEAPAVSTPEQQRSVEQQQPAPVEVQQPVEVPKPGARASTSTQAPATPAAPIAQPKTQARQDIANVLSEGLTQVYQGMTPQEQQAFRVAGEQAASQIEAMMKGFHATARAVLGIIRQWLRLIPRVNKYFLEQESKIKTDKMMSLQRKLKKLQRQHHIRME